jgi:hypothetical protein
LTPSASSPVLEKGPKAAENAPLPAKEGEQPMKVLFNGAELNLNPPPKLHLGQAFLPLIAWKRLGCTVEWQEGGKLIVICYKDRCVPLRLGDEEGALRLDGKIYTSALRVSEALGMKAKWDPERNILSFAP